MTRILLADHHHRFRQVIRDMLAKEPDFVVVGETTDGASALRLFNARKPDVIVLEVAITDPDETDAALRIIASFLAAKVVVLSLHAERQYIEAARRAGAAAFVLKDHALEELGVAIRAVIKGQTYFVPYNSLPN